MGLELLATRVSDDSEVVAIDDGVDSMMELELPGEVKKKRCEAKTVAKSGSESESDSGWGLGSEEREEEWVKDLVVEWSKVLS